MRQWDNVTAIGCRLSAVGCRLSAIGYRLARWAPLGGASINAAFGGENRTTALRALEMHSPFGGWRHHLSPSMRGHYKAPLCCKQLMKGMLRGVLFCPLNRGKSGAARIGGGERSEPVSRMLFMPYDTESKSRNADFILIARKGDTATLGLKGRQT